MNKNIRLGALLLTSLTALTSCGGGGDQSNNDVPGGTVIVEVWVHKNQQQPEGRVYNSLMESFNNSGFTTASGANIRMSMVFCGSTIATRIASAQLTGGLPDVLAVDCTDITSYVDAGLLVSIDDTVTTEDSYVDSVIDECTIDGSLYALSGMEAPGGLYMNTGLLAQVGYTEEDYAEPWSWKDVKEAMEKLYAADLPYQIQLNQNFGTDGAMYFHSNLVYSAGGDFGTDGAVEAALTTPEALAGIEQLEMFYTDDGLDNPRTEAWAYTGSNASAFEQGEVAFEIYGPWDATTIEKNKYTSAQYEHAAYNNYQILPYPVYEDASGNKSTLVANPCGSYCFGVTKDTENKEAATVALEYLTGRDATEAMFSEIGTFPTNKDSLAEMEQLQTGAFKQLADNLSNNEFTRPKMVKYPQMKDAYTRVLDYIKNSCNDASYDLEAYIRDQMGTVDSAR